MATLVGVVGIFVSVLVDESQSLGDFVDTVAWSPDYFRVSRSDTGSAGHLVSRSFRPRSSGYDFYAHNVEPQPAYPVKDAVQLRLVDNFPRENRLAASRLDFHILESRGKAFAELFAHHYAVNRALMGPGPILVSVQDSLNIR